MDATTNAAPRQPRSRRPVHWRRTAAVATGVLAVGGLGALVHDTAEPSRRPAVVVTPAAPSGASSATSRGPADAFSIWSALLQLDAAQDAAARAPVSRDAGRRRRADRKLADSEAARQANPDTIGITEMYGAFWAAPPLDSTLAEMCGDLAARPPDSPLVEMCGAYWAALGTIGITETYVVFWAAPPPDSTLAEMCGDLAARPPDSPLVEMCGAYWAALGTIGITEMYGAFWAAPPPV